ncbi:hypothetical protein [Enterococcus faecium]|uniref:hypothetical protein n=1 Tax=Enterococcus faecium TaxID=1352 RepID=UPI003C6CE0FA
MQQNLTAYLVWILSTLVGALIGNLIPDPNQFGLDFALVAMFVGLIVLQIDDQLKTNKRNTLLIILSVGFCCKVLNLLSNKVE